MKLIRSFIKEYPYKIVFVVCALAFEALTAWLLMDYKLPLAEFIVTLLFIVVSIIAFYRKNKRLKDTLKNLTKVLDTSEKETLMNFPFAISVCDVKGEIIWYNDRFSASVLADEPIENKSITEFTSGMNIGELSSMENVSVKYRNKEYSVFISKFNNGSETLFVLYFIDDTYLKQIANEYKLSRPAILLFSVDNMDEIYKKFTEQETAIIVSEINKIIDAWMSNSSCLVRRISNSRYIAIVEERDLQEMIAKKFDILDKIRTFKFDGRNIGSTLSIGVGRGENFRERYSVAKESIEMAQGRGGDQVAIKNKGNFEFFGGVSRSVEKRTKVKSRIIASAISELLEGSENILIMGHRYSDLDSLGAAVGLYSAARAAGKRANIVVSKNTSLAGSLIDILEKNGFNDVIVDVPTGMKLLTKKTLLFIVDTHRADFTESKELYEKASSVVVIDHHRKTVDHISNAIIFYHEPSASSVSEMVAEMIQYMPASNKLEKIEAEAMLAGITLDTKNFVLQTGVRTFEAAAFLKSKGADTVMVRQLFSISMENLRLRNEIIDGAEIYNNCAVATTNDESTEIRMFASQAADEMLNIDGIKASFVIFKTGKTTNISARSLGEVNVQIIMEALDGGGHLTMAAAQLEDVEIEEAKERLIEVLNSTFENKPE